VTPPRAHPGFRSTPSPFVSGPDWRATYGTAARQVYEAHLQLIAWNPITLTFHRYSRGRQRGGFTDWTEDPRGGIPYEVRFFQQGRGSSPVSEPTTGNQERDATWGFIADDGFPLRSTDGEDGNVRMEVFHPVHGRLRVRRLRALERTGVMIGWQGDLERVAGSAPEQVPTPPVP
jgi:hypothetical protein